MKMIFILISGLILAQDDDFFEKDSFLYSNGTKNPLADSVLQNELDKKEVENTENAKIEQKIAETPAETQKELSKHDRKKAKAALQKKIDRAESVLDGITADRIHDENGTEDV